MTRFLRIAQFKLHKEDTTGLCGDIHMSGAGQLIKLDTGTISFPQRCPVCGAPATTEGVIPAISMMERQKSSTPATRIGPYGAHYSPRLMPKTGRVSRFFVPTCEEHGTSFEDTARYKGPFALCSGLMMILTVIVIAWIVLGYAAYTPVDSTAYVVLGAVILVGIGAYFASGPSELERAISVVDMSPRNDYVILKIRNPEYADDIIQGNPMTAKRVKRVATS